jgi:hypothetical protein
MRPPVGLIGDANKRNNGKPLTGNNLPFSVNKEVNGVRTSWELGVENPHERTAGL